MACQKKNWTRLTGTINEARITDRGSRITDHGPGITDHGPGMPTVTVGTIGRFGTITVKGHLYRDFDPLDVFFIFFF